MEPFLVDAFAQGLSIFKSHSFYMEGEPMQRPDGEQLLTQLGQHVGMKDVPRFLANRLLRVDGHDLSLAFDDSAQPGILQARLDLGCMAAAQQERLCHRLLLGNFEWSGFGAFGWSLAPEGNLVVFSARFRFDAWTTGVELAQWLRRLIVCAATYWRELQGPQAVPDIHALAPLMTEASPLSNSASEHKWMQLVEEVVHLRATGSLKGDAYSENVAVSIDGVSMLLRHHHGASDRFEVRVDLGPGQHLQRKHLWLGLLWSNFMLGTAEDALLSVHPRNDRVILMLQQGIPPDATARALMELLQSIAASSRDFWSQVVTGMSYFDRT